MDRIFVQIASYRDPECQWTVKYLFEKAARPERVFIGICWQYDPETDQECFQFATRPEQVRISPWHWREGKGVCWARHEAQKLWEGEEYALFIDSHMRFEEGWDDKLIAELAECGGKKAVLTNHPAAYTPPNHIERFSKPTILRAHPYNEEGDMRFRGDFLDRAPDHPLPGAFIAAGFMFAPGRIIKEVPYDPYMYFNQEELSLAARFYTHGYDIFSPKDILLYHYYHDPNAPRKRPLHWDDSTDWVTLQDNARKRLDHLLGYKLSTDPIVTRELDRYGLGSARSLEEYQEYCGIDFKQKTLSEKALRCGFIPDLARWRDKPVHIPEIDQKAEAEALLTPELHAPETFPEAAVQINARANLPLWGPSPDMRLAEDAPPGVLVIYDYLDAVLCEELTRYADSQTYTDLDVLDHANSTKEAIVTVKNDGRVTNHVDIDGKAYEILSVFNDIYLNRLSAFYNASFEWYERPQILRYPPGGKYNQHADADHWLPDEKRWERVQDRDYSVLLYLNDAYEGGEIHLVNQNFKIKPKPGMLLAFPSGSEYLHAALPTLSGIRYVIVSWAAIIGSPRVRPQMPYASVFVRQKRG